MTSNASRRVVGQWGGAGGACCEDHFGLVRRFASFARRVELFVLLLLKSLVPITTAQAVVERFGRRYARHLSRAGRSGPEGSRASRRALGRAEIGAARGVWSAPTCAAPGSGPPATAEAGPAYASAPANAYSGPG